jgi:hydroxyacid-oxoacid transhydrogenase
VTREVGLDLKDLKAKNVLVVTDPNLAAIPNGPVDVVRQSLQDAGINFKLFTYVWVIYS